MQAKEIVTLLMDRLWENYRARVSYAQRYADLVVEQGGRVVNDHIALRTFSIEAGQPAGIEALSRLFLPFGYQQVGTYDFPGKHLHAVHLQHDDELLPKIFISTLDVDSLPKASADIVRAALAGSVDPLSQNGHALLRHVGESESLPQDQSLQLVEQLAACFVRPWAVPKKADILALNKDSQYAAWTLLHGNSVNHFTAYINMQQVAAWGDLKATAQALAADGMPMKEALEGSRESMLMQTATHAVDEQSPVIDEHGNEARLEWSYAYYELAERFEQEKGKLFQGFLGEQATNLFEMTARKS